MWWLDSTDARTQIQWSFTIVVDDTLHKLSLPHLALEDIRALSSIGAAQGLGRTWTQIS